MATEFPLIEMTKNYKLMEDKNKKQGNARDSLLYKAPRSELLKELDNQWMANEAGINEDVIRTLENKYDDKGYGYAGDYDAYAYKKAWDEAEKAGKNPRSATGYGGYQPAEATDSLAAMIKKQSEELTPYNPFIDDVETFDFPEPDKPKATKTDIAKIVAGYTPPTQVPGMTTYGLDPMQKAQLMQMTNPFKNEKGALNTINTGAQGAAAGFLNVLHNIYGAGVPGGLSINPYKRQQQLDAIQFERPLTEKEIFDRTIELQKAGTPYAYSGAKEAMANAMLQGNALQAASKSDMANALQNQELLRLQQAALKDAGATRREGMTKRYQTSKSSSADVNMKHSGGSGGGGNANEAAAAQKLLDELYK